MVEIHRAPPVRQVRETADRLHYLSVAVAGERNSAADCLRYSLERLAMLTDDVYSALPEPPPHRTVECFAQALHETQMHILHLDSLHRMHAAMRPMTAEPHRLA